MHHLHHNVADSAVQAEDDETSVVAVGASDCVYNVSRQKFPAEGKRLRGVRMNARRKSRV
ncbi:hypothetical protein EYF80_060007 [Liparis tanakae]|uniref:Uncharacterized protein n=1 Tax=Liparis tanakae TaxID=230148 RepID=A0A4Z2ELW6_9TELE|nr:hypothetical protein EYF80_060007 [Liparis tanakae]